MAINDPVVKVLQEMPPGADVARLSTITGGSTPPEIVPVRLFDDAAIEVMDYKCRLVGYDGGGITIQLPWSADTATTNEVRWNAGIRRFDDNAEDLDTSHSYAFNFTDSTAPTTSTGKVRYATITFTDGADMDLLVNGELFILRIRREATHANDDMAGDAELWAVSGFETA